MDRQSIDQIDISMIIRNTHNQYWTRKKKCSIFFKILVYRLYAVDCQYPIIAIIIDEINKNHKNKKKILLWSITGKECTL